MASDSIDASPYNATVLAHFRQPNHAGLPETRTGWLTAQAGKRAQGCEFTLAARVEAGKLAELRFAAYGCPHAIAAADWAASQLEGQPVETLDGFRGLDSQEPLDVPDEKLAVLLLLEDAMQSLVNAIAPNESEN